MRSFAMAVLLASASALATSASATAVKEKVAAAKASGKPVVVAVDKGEYTCSSCEPADKVKVGAGPQKVAGNSDYNQIAVEVKNPTEFVVSEYLNDKYYAAYWYTVSGDGKTLTVKWTDYSEKPKLTSGGYTAKRVGAAPAGAHAASGSWQIVQTMPEKHGME